MNRTPIFTTKNEMTNEMTHHRFSYVELRSGRLKLLSELTKSLQTETRLSELDEETESKKNTFHFIPIILMGEVSQLNS